LVNGRVLSTPDGVWVAFLSHGLTCACNGLAVAFGFDSRMGKGKILPANRCCASGYGWGVVVAHMGLTWNQLARFLLDLESLRAA
jgi:hypothetical protein